MLRLLVSAGGTGGGVYPALAVLEELRQPVELLWVGGEDGMEAGLVERAKLPFRAIPAAGVHGVGWRVFHRNIWKLIRGTFAARKIVHQFRPDVMFFTGGYVAVPVALGGRGVPKVIYVPDIEPGLALKWVSSIADRIMVSVEASKAYYRKKKKVRVTGYPVRRQMRGVERSTARRQLGLANEKPVLLVYGGSRGARSINYALWDVLETLLTQVQIIHLTGELDWPEVERVRSQIPDEIKKDYHPYVYLHGEIAFALAASDLAICRAGAATLGELPAFGLPAILVPYPYAWRYQKVNADYLTQQGAAVQVADEQLKERLLPMVLELINDTNRLSAMHKAAVRLAKPEAARSIAEEIESFSSGEEPDNG